MVLCTAKSKKYGGIHVTKKNNELSFEEALHKLEEIVSQLEKEDVPLEKAIALYEEGMQLSKTCDAILSGAQEKMTHILNNENKMEPFELQEG